MYSEIHPHDITAEELKAFNNVKGIILNGGESRIVDGQPVEISEVQYLKEHKQFVYIHLLTSGRLNECLVSVDEQAEDMFSRLVKEYADRQGLTEQLKAGNQLEWGGRMNNIRACVRELVDRELVYV